MSFREYVNILFSDINVWTLEGDYFGSNIMCCKSCRLSAAPSMEIHVAS